MAAIEEEEEGKTPSLDATPAPIETTKAPNEELNGWRDEDDLDNP